MTTFGFEAEFTTNANAVIAALHTLGLSGSNHLHGYHCDCDACEFGNGQPFRGQTDSSCSGEIISDVLGSGSYPNDTALMEALCETAVEVDAEPGANSGFHVHVGVERTSGRLLQDALWQFVRWEPVLARIAGGRWATRRDGMNRAVRDDNGYTFVNHNVRATTGGFIEFERDENEEDVRYFKEALWQAHYENDRHSNLNIAARNHPTWEFRIWNSTRSAWRMEMFCGLSVALLDQNVVEGLSELAPPTRMSRPSTGIDSIALACANGGFDRVSELLERQGAYLNDRAHDAPAVLTSL